MEDSGIGKDGKNMNPMERIAEIGILPVISIKRREQALALADALALGGVPAMEITLRTDCALSCIGDIARERPGMVVGAGTVMHREQADAAMAAGASYLVMPGYSDSLVEYCVEKGYPVVPGCATGGEIMRAMEHGLRTVKFFPAEPSGGLAAIKLLSGPFPGVKFVPTGGMTMENIGAYLAQDCIAACGGSFMAKSEDVAQENWAKITEMCRRCVDISLGFSLAHVGINNADASAAQENAQTLAAMFRLPMKVGNSSSFAARDVEFMHNPYYGAKGHIGFYTNSVSRALAYFREQGIGVREESIRKDAAGKLVSFYLEREIGGFAVHVVRRS